MRLVVAIFIMTVVSACSLPAYTILEGAGQDYEIVSSGTFKHLLALKNSTADGGALIVFVDGDGIPWQRRNRISFEPTSNSPLLLRWFVESSMPSVYLGRPCYFGLDDEECSAYWYTHGRYSPDVVNSLVEVLNQTVEGRPLVLIGHSGGGTLVMLMAEKMPNVKMVVTIAGNLQVKRWVDYHGYSDLAGSLDPSLRPGLNSLIHQIHVYSPNDNVIKSEWIRQFSLTQKNVELIEMPAKNHSSGWDVFRQEIMSVLEGALYEIGSQ